MLTPEHMYQDFSAGNKFFLGRIKVFSVSVQYALAVAHDQVFGFQAEREI
jgi:hypothetical protein